MANAKTILFPGRSVQIDSALGELTVRVYPVGWKEIESFSSGITRIVTVLANAVSNGAAVDTERAAAYVTAALMPAAGEFMELLEKCCEIQMPDEGLTDASARIAGNTDGLGVSIGDLPHWALTEIIEAFILENTDTEKKILPLAKAADSLLEKLTGKKGNSRETLSRFFSGLGTVSAQSSTSDNPDSPTPVGAGLSSVSS